MADVVSVTAVLAGVAANVSGAEAFAEHLAPAAVALQVSTFALALLLAGAEPEELATGIAASLRHAPAVAFGDVIGANVAMCLVALGVGAVVALRPTTCAASASASSNADPDPTPTPSRPKDSAWRSSTPNSSPVSCGHSSQLTNRPHPSSFAGPN